MKTKREIVWEEKRRRALQNRQLAPPPKVVPGDSVHQGTKLTTEAASSVTSSQGNDLFRRVLQDRNSASSPPPMRKSMESSGGRENDPLFEAMVQAEMRKLESQYGDQMHLLESSEAGGSLSESLPAPADADMDAGTVQQTVRFHGLDQGQDNAASPSLPDSSIASRASGFGRGLSTLYGGGPPPSEEEGGPPVPGGAHQGQGRFFGKGLNTLYAEPGKAGDDELRAKRQQQEEYARALAEQLSEKRGGGAVAGAARGGAHELAMGEDRSSTVPQQTGLLIGGGSRLLHPGGHAMSPPRRRGPGLDKMWADPQELRYKTLEQREYARMLDQQVAEKRQQQQEARQGGFPVERQRRHSTGGIAVGPVSSLDQAPRGRPIARTPRPLDSQSPIRPSGLSDREIKIQEQQASAEKKAAYAAILRQQIMENEERKRREKEAREHEPGVDCRTSAYRDQQLGAAEADPREWQVGGPGAYVVNPEDLVPGPFGMRRRGGGGEPSPAVGYDFKQRHSKLQQQMAHGGGSPESATSNSLSPTRHVVQPPQGSMAYPYTTPPPAAMQQQQQQASSMSEARKRLVRDVYGSTSPWGVPSQALSHQQEHTCGAGAAAAVGGGGGPGGSAATFNSPQRLQQQMWVEDLQGSMSSSNEGGEPMARAAAAPTSVSPSHQGPPPNIKASFAKHGALAYDPNAQHTLLAKHQAALEQRSALEQQIEERRRAREEEKQRRKAEEYAEMLRHEEERKRLLEEQEVERRRRDAEEREAHEARQLEAQRRREAAAAASSAPTEPAGRAARKRRESVSQPPDRHGDGPEGRDAAAAAAGGSHALSAPASARSRSEAEQQEGVWETLTSNRGGKSVFSRGAQHLEGDGRGVAAAARASRRSYVPRSPPLMVQEEEDPLERSLATESKFIALDEASLSPARSFVASHRSRGPAAATSQAHSRSPYRRGGLGTKQYQEHDEMDAFVDNWQRSHGLNAPPHQRAGPMYRHGVNGFQARPAGPLLGDDSLASDSTLMPLTEEEKQAEAEWLMAIGGGTDSAAAAKQEGGAAAPLSPLSELLHNHQEIQPDERALDELRRMATSQAAEGGPLGAGSVDSIEGLIPRKPTARALDNEFNRSAVEGGAQAAAGAAQGAASVVSDGGEEYGDEAFEDEDEVGHSPKQRRKQWKAPASEEERRKALEGIISPK